LTQVVLIALAASTLLAGSPAAAAPARRPAVDKQAMREAMSSSFGEDEYYGSSASYAHFLRSRLAHHDGDHRRALDELRLALASDDGNPFLMTAAAEELARLSDLDRAERELRRVIERMPTYHPAQLLMGRVLFEGGRYTRARVHLLRAIKLRPRDTEAYLVLTQLWLELRKPDEAVKVVEELAAAIPGEAVGFKRLGLALSERNDNVRAEKLLRRAIDKDPSDFETWVTLAQVQETLNRTAEAEESFSRALERDPDNREVLLAAGRLALRQGSATRARAYFDRLLSLSQDPEIAVKVAFSYLSTRHLNNAVEVLDNARKQRAKDDTDVISHKLSFYAGLVHERLSHHQRAADAYAEVPESSELFHEARLHRATCLSSAGQHKAALELLKKGVEERPDYLLLYPAYARALERAGQHREAEGFITRSMKDRPSPELFDALASLFERQGKLPVAIDLLSDALRARPNDEALLYTLGTAYERRGDTTRSLEKMRAVLEVNPENAMAMNFIGYALTQRGRDLEEAEGLLKKALELKPDTGAFLDSLGWLYFRRGDYARAIDTLERAAALESNEPTVLEHLGDAYSKLAKRTQAVDAYRKALEVLRDEPELAESKSQKGGIEKKLKMLSSETADR
jgi:tetratricopeptide (TPR) repeat protein